jgi:rhamnosyltransferase
MPYSRIVVICPTYNAGHRWSEWCRVINSQILDFKTVIIDSGSRDDTILLAKNSGFDVIQIPNKDFNHAGTRNQAIEYAVNKYVPELVVLLTQDSLLSSSEVLERLIVPFEDSNVVAVYGRQLPHADANPLAEHARLFNYGENSYVRNKASIPFYGLKTAFISNSCAVYRIDTFNEFGGFPDGLILGEDTCLAAKFILGGYSIGYASDAIVYHSHNYTLYEEFKRYFDFGVLHASQDWLTNEFGVVEGEGLRFAKSEISHCFTRGALLWLANSIIRSMLKITAYKIGKKFHYLPVFISKKLSMDRNYWSFR